MASEQQIKTIGARWVFPADRAPLPGGTVTIQGDTILAVEAAGTRAADVDLGNVAVLPGLVNAHTHLDLSDALGKVPTTLEFTQWLRGVIAHRRAQTAEQRGRAISDGIAACLRHGVTLVGDIAAGGQSWEWIAQQPLRATVYFEIIGLSHDRLLNSLSEARAWLTAHPPTPTCRPGWSPHAPYSVGSMGFENARGYGRLSPIPIATHLAETLAERELLERREGPFAEFLRELGVWSPDELVRDWNDVLQLTARSQPISYVHANYLDGTASIPPHGAIVYCPRTHAAFGHPPHPFQEFQRRGVRVVLGTDSLASNPDLDILGEARFLRTQHPDLPGEALLRMITLDGAVTLGWEETTGSLTPGKSADLVVLPLPDRDDHDPYALVFDSALPVQRVLFRGTWRL